MDDLGYVLRVLHDVELEASWRPLGQVLKIIGLGAISGDPSDCLLQVVVSWLRGHTRLEDESPSWWRVIWAVADEQGGRMFQPARRIAKQDKGICAKYVPTFLLTNDVELCN